MADIKHALIAANRALQGTRGQGQVTMAGSGQLPETIGELNTALAQLRARAQALGIGGTVQGDGLVAPMNAAPSGGVGIGVQPGTSNAIVVAQFVIITNSGGWFIYSGTPGLGNPPIIWASGGSLVDPYGNALPYQFGITGTGTFQATDTLITPAGIFVFSGTPATGNLLLSFAPSAGTILGNAYNAGAFLYGPGSSFVGLFDDGSFANLLMQPPGPLSHMTTNPAVLSKALAAGAANEQIFAVLTSGKESGRNDAAVQVFSDSADGTIIASAVIEFGGSIFFQATTAAFTVFAVPIVVKSQTIPGVVFIPSGAVHISTNPEVFGNTVSPGAANEQLLAVLSSGKESSQDDAAIQLFSESADATIPARAVLEFGGTVIMQVSKNGTILSGQATPPQSSGNAVLYSTTHGNLQVVDGTDAQTYGTQRRTLILASDTPLAASPGTTLFTSTVGVRSYRVHGMILVSITTAVQQLSVNIAPPAGTGFVGGHIGRAANFVDYVNFNLNSLTGVCAAGALGIGAEYLYFFDSIINVTSAGALNFIFAGTNAGDITALANSYVEILPV